jgi:hypothetical protein
MKNVLQRNQASQKSLSKKHFLSDEITINPLFIPGNKRKHPLYRILPILPFEAGYRTFY